MPLSNNVPKKLVKIVLAVKVYADGDIERSIFDNLLGEEALAKTGETTVRSSMIKDLGLDFSYNDKNYKSAIIDLYNQLQDLYEWAEIMDEKDSLGASVYVRDDDNTKVNVAQRRIPIISFVIDRYDPDAHDKVSVVEDKIISTFDFHGIYVDYDEDFIEIETREI